MSGPREDPAVLRRGPSQPPLLFLEPCASSRFATQAFWRELKGHGWSSFKTKSRAQESTHGLGQFPVYLPQYKPVASLVSSSIQACCKLWYLPQCKPVASSGTTHHSCSSLVLFALLGPLRRQLRFGTIFLPPFGRSAQKSQMEVFFVVWVLVGGSSSSGSAAKACCFGNHQMPVSKQGGWLAARHVCYIHLPPEVAMKHEPNLAVGRQSDMSLGF